MKFIDLYIYGFGRFENERITLDDGSLTVFYGRNESGKSTVLAYIEYMLFGFPKRTEKRLRYEPKTTQAYGGKLTLETEQHGRLTIERKGDRPVTVTRADGTEEDESVLKQILSEVNQLTYRDIFSFNLDGLQRIDQIRSEELGNYLFNAAMTGAHELNRISDYLEEQQGKLFKPNGRNPVLNQQLAQLIEQDRDLQGWIGKLDDYDRVKSELAEKRIELENDETEQQHLMKQRKDLEKIQSVAPLIEQKMLLEHQLEHHQTALPFPENGLERFRNWKERKVEAEAEADHFQELIQVQQRKLDVIEVDDRLYSHSEDIDRLEKEYESYKVRKSDFEKVQQRIRHLSDELEREQAEIGEGWTEESIKNTRTDVVAKQQIKQLIKEHDDLQFQRNSLDRDLQHARESIEGKERQLEAIEQKLLPDEQVQADEKKLRSMTENSPDTLKKQLETLKRLKTSRKPRSIHTMLTGAMILIGVLLMGIWIYRGDVVEGLILGVVLIGSGFIFAKKNSKDDFEPLDQQIAELKNELDRSTAREDLTVLQDKIEGQRQLKYRKQQYLEEYDQLERRYQSIAADYDSWEIRFQENDGKLKQWRNEFEVPDTVSNEMVVEMMERVEHLKKRIHELERMKEEIRQLKKELAVFESEVNRLATIGAIKDTAVDTMVNKLIKNLQTERENREQRKRAQSEIDRNIEQLESLKRKIRQYEQECSTLLETAEVENEEQFWVKGKEFENYQSLDKELHMTVAQLQMMATEAEVNEYSKRSDQFSELDSIVAETDTALEDLDVKIRTTRETCANLQARLTQLEEDGTYSDLLHKIESAKSEFLEQAKKWAVYRTADYVLKQAKQNYQSKKQPGVLERAGDYFQRLTAGEYVKLLAPKDEESFLIERNDTILFKPEELSRATAEQLYLALRFALAHEYATDRAFPFIIDDVLVNFDETRRQKAVELIRSIARDRQVIYFTCDERTADALSSGPIVLEPATAPVLP